MDGRLTHLPMRNGVISIQHECQHRLAASDSRVTVQHSASGAGKTFESGEGTRPAPGIFFLVCLVPLHLLALQLGLQIVVLMSAFVVVTQYTVWSVSCLLFYSQSHGAPTRSHL